jgi:hypothetical protein
MLVGARHDEALRALPREFRAQPRQLFRATALSSFHERENSKAWRRKPAKSGISSRRYSVRRVIF